MIISYYIILYIFINYIYCTIFYPWKLPFGASPLFWTYQSAWWRLWIPNCNWVQHHPLCHIVKISTHSNWKQGDGPLAGNSWVNLNWHEAGVSNMYQISDWKCTWMSCDSKHFVQKRFETFRFKALIRHGPQPKRARWIFKSCLIMLDPFFFIGALPNSSTLCKGAGRWKYTRNSNKPWVLLALLSEVRGDMAPGLEHGGLLPMWWFCWSAHPRNGSINWASSQSVKPHIGMDSKMGCQTNSLWFAWKKTRWHTHNSRWSNLP